MNKKDFIRDAETPKMLESNFLEIASKGQAPNKVQPGRRV